MRVRFPHIKYERKDDPLINQDNTINSESIINALDEFSCVNSYVSNYLDQCYDLTSSIIELIERKLSRPPARPYAEYKVYNTKIIVVIDKRDLSEIKLEANCNDLVGLKNIISELEAVISEVSE